MRKYKIKFGEDPLPDDEILHFQNFNQVLKKHELAVVKAAYQTYFWKGWVIVGAIMVLSTGYYFYQKRTKPVLQPAVVATPHTTPSGNERKPSSKEAVVMPNTQNEPVAIVPPVLEKLPDEVLPTTSSKPPAPVITVVPNAINSGTPLAESPLSSPEAESIEVVFTEAIPVDGYPALYRYFRTNLQLPEDVVLDRMSNTVIVGFSIDKNGKPTNIQVLEGVNKSIDLEAIRLIEQMPAWVPAMVNDKPITTRLVIPITFQLTHLEKKPLYRP